MSLVLELRGNLLGHVDRDRKANSLAFGNDGCVDAHHLAFQIDEWTSAVSGVDGGVGLNKVVIRPRSDHSSLGADNAGGHGLFQSERAPNGYHPAAHLQ